MSLKPVAKKNLVEQTIDSMTRVISSGEWPVGKKIPTEPEICESLNISRGTVREAVRALSHRGLLEVKQGAGTYVATDNELLIPIEKATETHSFQEVVYLRTGLDIAATLGAVENSTPADLKKMEEILCLREEYRATKNMQGWIQTELDFHEAVIMASHNSLLMHMYRGLRPVLEENLQNQIVTADFKIPRTPHGHETLLQAIKKQDSQVALREALINLEEVQKFFKA